MNAAPPALRASTVTTVKMTAVSNKMINRIILIHLLSIKGIANLAKNKSRRPRRALICDG